MKINATAHIMLFCAILLGCAGIFEPSPVTAAAVALITALAFTIIVVNSDNLWVDGYNRAQRDMLEDRRNSVREPLTGSMRFKCGMEDCACYSDSSYVVSK